MVELYAEAVSPSSPRCTRVSPCRRSKPWRVACRSWRPPAEPCRRWLASTEPPDCWFHPATPAALAAAIAAIMEDPELAARLAADARRRVLERFTWQPARWPPPRVTAGRSSGTGPPDGNCRFRADRPLRTAGVPGGRSAARPRRRRRAPCLRGAAAGRRRHRPRRRRGRDQGRVDHDGRHRPGRSGRLATRRGGHGGGRQCPPPSLRAEAFDRVIAAEVLEHIPDDRGALVELARVLRPGGTLAVTVPRWWPELLNWALSDDYHTTPGGHVRIYRRGVLVERLGRAGLELMRPITPTPCTAPTGGSGPRSGSPTTPTPGSGPTTGCWSGISPPTPR